MADAHFPPGSDVAAGNWTPSTAGSLFDCVDESVPSDADFIRSGANPDGDVVELKFASVVDPQTRSGHVVRYRINGGDSRRIVVSLVCGSTVISSWDHAPAPDIWTEYDQAVDPASAALISDYSDLRVRFTAYPFSVPGPIAAAMVETATLTVTADASRIASGAMAESLASTASTDATGGTAPTPPLSPGIVQYQLFDGGSGPMRTLWNNKIAVPWTYPGGDWLDANQTPQGTAANYGSFTQGPTTALTQKTVSGAGMVALVQRWITTGFNRGIVLKSNGPSPWAVNMAGRLYADSTKVPTLSVTTEAGQQPPCPCTATCRVNSAGNSWLDGRTTFPAGAGGIDLGMLQFDLSTVTGSTVSAATLTVWVTSMSGSQSATVVVYEINPPAIVLGGGGRPPMLGLAQDYADDVGIGGHPNVILATDFTATTTKLYATGGRFDAGGPGNVSRLTYSTDPETGEGIIQNGFGGPGDPDPLYGGDLNRYVVNGTVDPVTTKCSEICNELWMRYYVKFNADWGARNQMYTDTTNGYKMPGIAGEWGVWIAGGGYRLGGYWNNGATGGSGGGGCTGKLTQGATPYHSAPSGNPIYFDGWSMRGHGHIGLEDGNPYDAIFAIRNYCYSVDQPSNYGEMFEWGVHFQKETWYCIEQHIRMNTIDMSNPDALGNGVANYDGVFEVWVDGVKLDLPPGPRGQPGWRWSHHPDFGILSGLLNWYHGGTEPTSTPYHAEHYQMKGLVLARQYIGPRVAQLPSWVPTVPGTLANVTASVSNTFASQVATAQNYSNFYSKKIISNSDYNAHRANPYWGNYGGVVCHGGGHSATNDNSVFVLELGRTALTWKRVNVPTDFGAGLEVSPMSAITNDFTGVYETGPQPYQPGSFHSYDTLEILPPANGGATNGSLLTILRGAVGYAGTGPNDVQVAHQMDFVDTTGPFIFNQVSNSYVSPTNVQAGAATAYDQMRNRVWLTSIASANPQSIWWYDVATRNYGSATYVSGARQVGGVNSGVMNYDSIHDALIFTCSDVSGGTVKFSYLLCSNPSAGWTTPSVTGTMPGANGGQTTFGYVPTIDKWILHNRGDVNNAYELVIPASISGTWTLTPRSVSVPFPAGYTNGKLVYLPAVKCFVLIFHPGGGDTSTPSVYAYRPFGT